MKEKSELIFVVDDDKGINTLITNFLKKKGFKNVNSYYTGEEANENMKLAPFAVIQDFDLPGINGLQVYEKAKKNSPDSEFIFLSGQTNLQVAIDALKMGAFDYIIKDNYAKENVYYKLLKLSKYKRMEMEKASLKKLMYIMAGILIASWIAIILVKTLH